MPFAIDEELLDKPFEELDFEYTLSEPEKLINDSSRSVSLIANIINLQRTSHEIEKIKRDINNLFKIYEKVPVKNELFYYREMMNLCGRLAEHRKIKVIKEKSVIGIGGQFSAGKSKFINSLSGINGLLREDQKPTTAIPTYIVHAKKNRFVANTADGQSRIISLAEMQALTHHFYDKYKIGFSSFVESIIIESSDYSLDDKIALLDTPGYSKYDNGDNKNMFYDISDKENAYRQLGQADYIIWVSDINNQIKQEDINFIRSLNTKNPVLFILNKADTCPAEVKNHIRSAEELLDYEGINSFGVAAYSSSENRGYANEELISYFLHEAAVNRSHSNDLYNQFVETERNLLVELDSFYSELSLSTKEMYNFIRSSNNVSSIKSIAEIWSSENYQRAIMYDMRKNFERKCQKLNKQIKIFIDGGKING